MKNFICTIFVFCLLFSSCRDETREQEITKREQALQLREDAFAEKEQDYQSLLKMRDSIRLVKDSMDLLNLTVKPWPDSLAGRWNGKLICTETNCSDYVIGDQRTNIWEFDNDSTKLFVKVLNNKNEVLRIFNATTSEGNIRLIYQSDSTASKPTTISANLNKFNKGKINGMHTINVHNSCTTKFSVELNRPNTRK